MALAVSHNSGEQNIMYLQLLVLHHEFTELGQPKLYPPVHKTAYRSHTVPTVPRAGLAILVLVHVVFDMVLHLSEKLLHGVQILFVSFLHHAPVIQFTQ